VTSTSSLGTAARLNAARSSRRRTGSSASPRESQSALRPGCNRRRQCRLLQPPSPCRRGRPRFVARATWRLTGLSAALRHSALLAAGVLPAWRGARHPCRAHSAAPVQPALCQRAASASMRSTMRAAPAAQCFSSCTRCTRLRAIHGLPLRDGPRVARGNRPRLRQALVPRAQKLASTKSEECCSLLSSQRSTVLAASMPGPLRGSLREH
jgi:hypothetical protein